MNTRIRWIFLLMALASATAGAQPALPQDEMRAMELQVISRMPPAPQGYGWRLYRNAVFLKPSGWHEQTRDLAPERVPTYAMSPEEFSADRQFTMGMTLQIIVGPRQHAGIAPAKAALAFLAPYADSLKDENVLMYSSGKNGEFETTALRFRDAPPGLEPIIVHKFIMTNDAADSVHIFTFESLEATWQENWAAFGEPIFGKLAVLPNVAAR